MFKKLTLAMLLVVTAYAANAQYELKAYLGAGYGLENRIGFRGISIHGDGQLSLFDHIQGVVGLQYFTSNSVPKWAATENVGSYFRQFTAAVKVQYSAGEEAGQGFIANIGIGVRGGQTYHFETGNLHDGVYTDQKYIQEKLRGNGIILGLGYGFPITTTVMGRVEFNHYAFGTINDLQTISLKVGF